MRERASAISPTGGDDPILTGILAWWDEHHRELPWRETRDVYAIWVAEVMSAQTTLSRALAAWEGWMVSWPTVEALAAASLTDVLVHWQGLGYPRRARDLHRAAQTVTTDGWPADLTDLPGIGPYISAAIRCFALEQPVLPRDVNVERVLNRRLPAGVDITADPWRSGQALMEFGQRICRTVPLCPSCPVQQGCAGPGPTEAIDRARRRQKPYAGSLRQRRGRLLEQVLTRGSVSLAQADAEAAGGLIVDGLLRSDGTWLTPPR